MRAIFLLGGLIALGAADLAIICIRYPFDIYPMEEGTYGTIYHLMNTGSLYERPNLTFTANIYPPLYFLIGAVVGKCAGLSYASFRLISTVCAVISCGAIFSVVRRETGGRAFGLLGALLFLATFGMATGCYALGRVDTLAVMLLLVSIAFIRRGWIVPAALTLALCCFSKQTYSITAAVILLTQIFDAKRLLLEL